DDLVGHVAGRGIAARGVKSNGAGCGRPGPRRRPVVDGWKGIEVDTGWRCTVSHVVTLPEEPRADCGEDDADQQPGSGLRVPDTAAARQPEQRGHQEYDGARPQNVTGHHHITISLQSSWPLSDRTAWPSCAETRGDPHRSPESL